mmetsp:Transcript_86901/g.274380  ORF Transcript_86901/g.274380 Transcript_86901/m.274380 type:complete len:235 (-) Transcript_86901:75-779(-)
MRVRTAWTSASTPCRVASSMLSGGALPGSTTARKTEAVGQFTSTVWHRFTRSSPTCSQAAKASSASASASEPRGVATQPSSAVPSSRARRCAHCARRKAQLTVTGTGEPTCAPSATASSAVLKRRLRHMLRMEVRRSRSSSAVAIADGPTSCPSSGVLLMSRDSALETMRHFGTEGDRVAPATPLSPNALPSTAPLRSPPAPNLLSPPLCLPQKVRLRTRIACVTAIGGSVPGL